MGDVLASITDNKLYEVGGFATAKVVAAQDYFAFGAVMQGRSFQDANYEKYRWGFNGKEEDEDGGFQDYGMRGYDQKSGVFWSVDPIAAKYPELSPYQFASRSPISGVDLDGLEHYLATDGSYLGLVANSDITKENLVLVVDITRLETKFQNLANVHSLVGQGKMVANTIPVYIKYNEPSPMTIYQFLDLAHIMYGEAKGAQTDDFAHVMFNREIKMAKMVENDHKSLAGYEKEPTGRVSKTSFTASTSGKIKNYEYLGGVFYYSIYSNVGSDIAAMEKHQRVIQEGIPESSDGPVNKGYGNFFKYKSPATIGTLISSVTETTTKEKYPIQTIFSAIIRARLGLSVDKLPNYDSWRGRGTSTGFKNDIPKIKSDANK